ncbi:MAG: alpha/beta hydrolase [Acidimicrobiales bacterium]|nr:alpha/beta hydrolase [Acidimicrobiales bacterium]
MKPIVLVHGAWHGPWCWAKVLHGLRDAGITGVAPELPLREGPSADVAVVREVVTGLDDAVVLGHSYGGVVISAACSGLTNVAHLVYLCAFQLAEEETTATVLGAFPNRMAACTRVDGDERTIGGEHLVELFYADCPAEDVALARRSLRPMPTTPSPALPYRSAWRDVPSTYVVCERDGAIPPAAQRAMAARARKVRRWDTSHSPFFSRPELVVELLLELAADG